MEVEIEYVTLAVKTITINGESFKVDDLTKFTEIACDHEHYIDMDDNYSANCISFNPFREDEVRLENMLLEQGIIREHGYWSNRNERVRNGELNGDYIRYKLTPKYHKFYDEVWDAVHKYECSYRK